VVRALRKRFLPDGRMLHAPMSPRVVLTDEEAGTIYAYLRTLPPVRNPISRPVASPRSGASRGEELYVSYGCAACHGKDGKGGGSADLTVANVKYPTDDALRDWIDNAPDRKPGTRMPAWRGIIVGEDYEPLVAHVRTLAGPSGQHASK